LYADLYLLLAPRPTTIGSVAQAGEAEIEVIETDQQYISVALTTWKKEPFFWGLIATGLKHDGKP
jgi:hypothetical protein